MHSILLQVLRGNWYIDQEFAHSAGFLIKSMLQNGLTFEGDAEKFKPQVNTYDEETGSASKNVSRNIAVIDISGPLMKQDQECGPAGMDTIGNWIKRFDADPTVGAIILKFDSPGGTVSGTEILGNIIRDCKKPIVSFIDEMACSAAYWLSSQCDKIVASIPRARVGSIGVMLSFMDMQPAWEKEGVVFHDINSDLSPDKNKDFKELQEGKYDNYKKNVLNPLAEDFHAVVKSTRTITDETILKGRVVFANEAKTIGLIDEIANWEETLKMVFTMAEEYEQSISHLNTEQSRSSINQSTTSLTNTPINMTKFKRVATIANVDSFESTEEGVHLQEETLELIEQALEQAETERTANETLTQAAETHQQDIEQRDARITELEQEVADVRAAAGSTSATITTKTDTDKVEDEDSHLRFVKEHAGDTAAIVEELEKEFPDLKTSR